MLHMEKNEKNKTQVFKNLTFSMIFIPCKYEQNPKTKHDPKNLHKVMVNTFFSQQKRKHSHQCDVEETSCRESYHPSCCSL